MTTYAVRREAMEEARRNPDDHHESANPYNGAQCKHRKSKLMVASQPVTNLDAKITKLRGGASTRTHVSGKHDKSGTTSELPVIQERAGKNFKNRW